MLVLLPLLEFIGALHNLRISHEKWDLRMLVYNRSTTVILDSGPTAPFVRGAPLNG